MFKLFERWVKVTALPHQSEPPPGLIAFYWHFARQTKGVFVGLFAAGFAVALIDVMVPVFIGKVVTLVTHSAPAALLAKEWPVLLAMAGVLLLLRPAAYVTQQFMMNQAIAPMSPTASAGRTTGMWCGSPGPSSRTTLPAASPTA
jgi:ATP-binding cassette subfamily B multidrug efflux pump